MYNVFVMLEKIIINLFAGLLVGYALEFSYRSYKAQRIIWPKFVNYQMYGLTAVFLVVLSSFNIPLFFKLVSVLLFTFFIELITGILYIKSKGVKAWDYSDEPYNYKGIVCPYYSTLWFAIATFYYFLAIPNFHF